MTLFVQLAVVLCTLALTIFVIDYTWLTKWANWKDPIGLTLTLEALLLIPDEIVALFRWFGPISPVWQHWEIWTQASSIWVIAIVLLWRVIVFNRVKIKGRDP